MRSFFRPRVKHPEPAREAVIETTIGVLDQRIARAQLRGDGDERDELLDVRNRIRPPRPAVGWSA